MLCLSPRGFLMFPGLNYLGGLPAGSYMIAQTLECGTVGKVTMTTDQVKGYLYLTFSSLHSSLLIGDECNWRVETQYLAPFSAFIALCFIVCADV